MVTVLGQASEIGDQPQVRTLAACLVGVGLVTANRRVARAGARVLLAHEVATAVKNFVKRRVDRTRPRSAGTAEDRKAKRGDRTGKEETSFPSGHSAGATAAALAIGAEFPDHRAPALLGAAAVSFAQVPRCAHYPTDVGAGILIGAISGTATNWAIDRVLGSTKS